jgi:5'-nucleotidase
MNTSHLRALGAGLAAAATAATLASAPAMADASPTPQGNPNATSVQLLSFNDYHGHLEATDGPLSKSQDPTQTPVGGAEYLSSKLSELRAKVGDADSLTVAAGDLIGGSTFLSGMFHDAEGSRSHGLNERIRVKSLMDGRQFLYEIVKIYANQND